MLKLCRNALRMFAAASLVVLAGVSGVCAQGNPISIGIGLALTGAPRLCGNTMQPSASWSPPALPSS